MKVPRVPLLQGFFIPERWIASAPSDNSGKPFRPITPPSLWKVAPPWHCACTLAGRFFVDVETATEGLRVLGVKPEICAAEGR
jgi:hypothetical protein